MKKILFFLLMIMCVLLPLTSCNNSNSRVQKWDNTKYSDFPSSVGINVYNEHSFNLKNPEDINSNKANRTLYITDLSKPITVKFNNNGKDRDFIMNVYYDYNAIDFKIDDTGKYDQKYIFHLADGYEIELPLYLPKDLEMSGSHKLLITFCIGPELHAKDLGELIDWYGSATIQDVVFEPDSINFSNMKEYQKPPKTLPLHYTYTLNQDYDYDVIKTKIMPNPPVVLTVKPDERFELVYNASYSDKSKSGQALLLFTIGFKQAFINDDKYLLLEIPKGSTGIGKIELTAPKEPGLYEIISYQVCSPFEKYDSQLTTQFKIMQSTRFTLEVEKP